MSSFKFALRSLLKEGLCVFPPHFRSCLRLSPAASQKSLSPGTGKSGLFIFLNFFFFTLPINKVVLSRLWGGGDSLLLVNSDFVLRVAPLCPVSPTGGNRASAIDPRPWNHKQEVSTQDAGASPPPPRRRVRQTPLDDKGEHRHLRAQQRALIRRRVPWSLLEVN